MVEYTQPGVFNTFNDGKSGEHMVDYKYLEIKAEALTKLNIHIKETYDLIEENKSGYNTEHDSDNSDSNWSDRMSKKSKPKSSEDKEDDEDDLYD